MAADTRPRLWLVDKPAGPTSHDLVAGLRRALPRRTKVGHAGTLDPFATGLMVLLSGRATRLAQYLSGLDKRYLATVRTGFTSATGDPEGPIVSAGPPASAAEIAAVLPDLRGQQRQLVPAYSAVQVDGERLYARARRGEEVERPEREVDIHSLELVEDLGDGCAVVAVHCSKGTYIRSLVEDIGSALGCGAYCQALRRTAIGSLSLTEAVAPEEALTTGGHDPRSGLSHLPTINLDAAGRDAISHGRAIAADRTGFCQLVADDRLIAIGEGDGSGTVRPRVVLAPAGEEER